MAKSPKSGKTECRCTCVCRSLIGQWIDVAARLAVRLARSKQGPIKLKRIGRMCGTYIVYPSTRVHALAKRIARQELKPTCPCDV